MLDIKRIRTDFDIIAKKLATRGVDAATLDKMKEFDSKRRELLVKVENLKAERNVIKTMLMIKLLPCKNYLLKLKH